ncbi:hypothetical protein C2G38_2030293 [Gigaspora rosea]|uniref:Uncharacterized protein n=1 Tax=Gigaspora rosea TaxID=44941 RepID=A0A397VX47_9GLOM|nr:hypothetical protein C2G38_2030293 [Gigaspora rosea]
MPNNIENCAEYPLDRKVFSPAPKTEKTPKKVPDKLRLFGILVIYSIIYLLFFENNEQHGQNISLNKTSTFQSIVDLAYSGSKNLSSLEIPETGEMSDYRIIIRDLGRIMEKSDIIVKNGKKLSEVLFGLDKEIQKAGDALEEFRHQVKSFYFSLAREMKAIMEKIEKTQHGTKNLIKLNNHMSNSDAEFIHKRLEVLEKQIPVFIEKLYQVLYAIDSVHNSADNTQGYLIDGEREAERALKKHWLGNIADYTVRKRAEDELIRVRITIKILKDIAPILMKFENFLKEYRRNIQDVDKEVKNAPTKPTADDMKYLKKAITDLEEQHTQFSSAKKHTKFSSEEYKPVDTYEDVENEDAEDIENNDSMLYAFMNKILKWTLDPVVFIVKYVELTLFNVVKYIFSIIKYIY